MDLATLLPQLIAPAITGALAFLVKSFLGQIAKDLAGLKADIHKLDGRFETIQKDVRDNTIEGAVMRQEVKAIWRAVDHSHRRASDANGRD